MSFERQAHALTAFWQVPKARWSRVERRRRPERGSITAMPPKPRTQRAVPGSAPLPTTAPAPAMPAASCVPTTTTCADHLGPLSSNPASLPHAGRPRSPRSRRPASATSCAPRPTLDDPASLSPNPLSAPLRHRSPERALFPTLLESVGLAAAPPRLTATAQTPPNQARAAPIQVVTVEPSAFHATAAATQIKAAVANLDDLIFAVAAEVRPLPLQHRCLLY